MTSDNDTPATGLDTASKTKNLIDAARRRNANAEQVDAEKADADKSRQAGQTARAEELAQERQVLADVNVQARAKTLTGEIDPMAMGDVKGDGRDAKDYSDNDPDKRLGVTTAEHGLKTSRDGADGEIATAFGHRISARTQAELERGRSDLEATSANRALRQEEERQEEGVPGPAPVQTTTVVTDADEDEDGDAGQRAAAEAAAAATNRPVLEDMTKAQLVEFAQKNEIEVDPSKNKPELLAQVQEGVKAKNAAGE